MLSYRTPWRLSWQRLHCLACGHFVSCCLGHFYWEANLLPLLLTHTVSTKTSGVVQQNLTGCVRTQKYTTLHSNCSLLLRIKIHFTEAEWCWMLYNPWWQRTLESQALVLNRTCFFLRFKNAYMLTGYVAVQWDNESLSAAELLLCIGSCTLTSLEVGK